MTQSVSKSNPNSSPSVILTNFYVGEDCPAQAIDPTFLMCDTDQCCCQWADVCEDEIVEIDGVSYYTWIPKGLQDDVTDPDNFSLHLHLACKRDSTGVRITGLNLVEIIEGLGDPGLIDQFCTWAFENCFQSDVFLQWICDTVLSFCLPTEVFETAFCEWFVNSILTDTSCIAALTAWFLNNETVASEFCRIMLLCLGRDSIKDLFCDLMLDQCLQNNNVRDLICDIIKDCLQTRDSLIDKICAITKTACVTTSNWDSSVGPNPEGTQADAWYLIDVSTDCITHICADGSWACVPAGPTKAPVLTDSVAVCPIVFPVLYNNDLYDSAAELADELTIEFGCPVTYDPVDCTMCFPFLCDSPPTQIDVSRLPTCVTVRVDGVVTCPLVFPLIYSGTTYNNSTDLGAALTLEFGCTATYRASDCNYCFEIGCDTPLPPFIDVTTPIIVPPTYAPVRTDGTATCPVVFPVVYNTVEYANPTDLGMALTLEYGCPVTYTAIDCTYCFPPECNNPPNFVDVTTPIVLPPDPMIVGGPSGQSCVSRVSQPAIITFTIANSNPSWTVGMQPGTICIGAGCTVCNFDLFLYGPGGVLIDFVPNVNPGNPAVFLGGNLIGDGVYSVHLDNIDIGCAGGTLYCLNSLNSLTLTP